MSNLHIHQFKQFGQYFSYYPYYLPKYYSNYYPRMYNRYFEPTEHITVSNGPLKYEDSSIDFENPMNWVALFVMLMILVVVIRKLRG